MFDLYLAIKLPICFEYELKNRGLFVERQKFLSIQYEKLKVENYKTCRFTEDEKEDKEDQDNKINLIDIGDFEPKIKTTKKATKKTSK